MAVGWTLHGDGSTPPPGEAVAPDERLSWGRTVGIGAQHVVAMFGATFVFPVGMGLDPNLAIMMSGVATILFLLIVGGKVPSYLGTSASFVGAVASIRAAGGDSATVTGAVLVAGLVLAVAIVAILFGLCPKFGALAAATPGGVLGGITVVLYGMIGLLGAKIWIENRVDFGDPVNLVPVAAGIILAVGNVTLKITHDFPLQGIALLVGYHALSAARPAARAPQEVE